MTDGCIHKIDWITRNAGAAELDISRAEQLLQVKFSEEYRDFLKNINGGNARTLRSQNICFFSTSELPEINAAAAIEEYLPGWLIFASDLGGKSYLLSRNRTNLSIVSCFDEVFDEGAVHDETKDLFEYFENLA